MLFLCPGDHWKCSYGYLVFLVWTFEAAAESSLFHVVIEICEDWIWDWGYILSDAHTHTHVDIHTQRELSEFCSFVHLNQCGYGLLHNTGRIPSQLSTDFLYQLTQTLSRVFPLFPHTLFPVSVYLPSPNISFAPSEANWVQGGQHCCANEKNADLDFSVESVLTHRWAVVWFYLLSLPRSHLSRSIYLQPCFGCSGLFSVLPVRLSRAFCFRLFPLHLLCLYSEWLDCDEIYVCTF